MNKHEEDERTAHVAAEAVGTFVENVHICDAVIRGADLWFV